MADTTCPNCGAELPSELGQRATSPTSGLVRCPSCGAGVTLREDAEQAGTARPERAAAAPPGRTEGRETFSGEETLDGVMDELRDKPG